MSEDRPLLSVVRGEPTPDQLAALVAVVSARAARRTASEADADPPTRWGAPASALRHPITPGAGAWRASARPGA